MSLCVRVIFAAALAAACASSRAAAAGDAAAAYERGIGHLSAGRIFDARAELSAAVLSGGLDEAADRHAVRALSAMAERMIFSPAEIFQGDNYVFTHTVESGQTIASIAGKYALGVPVDFILMVNAMKDAREAVPGRVIKLVKGPVHIVVTKSRFAMDLYLTPPGLPAVFLRRIPIGIGRNNGTPVGRFIVANKAEKAAWHSPADGPYRGRVISHGQRGYPFGKKGLWIGLKGAEPATISLRGYGVHSTSDQSSIGKARSHGCVRVGDSDIGAVFRMMSPGASTVQIRP